MYKAHEMRNAATAVEQSWKTNGHLGSDAAAKDLIVAMLRYAAEMVERCEKKRQELDEEWFYEGAYDLTMPMEDCYEIIDYILRGDAVKEEK